MKKIFNFLLFVIAVSFFSSCQKEAYEPADLVPAHTYWISSPKANGAEVVDGIFEFYVYDEVNQLTYYKGKQFAQCVVQDLVNFEDATDDEAYKFAFDCVLEFDKDGNPAKTHRYVVLSYKDRTTITPEGTYLESSITEYDENGILVKKYDNIRVMDKDRLIEPTR